MFILFIIFIALLIIPATQAMTSGQAIRHKAEKFEFQSGHFDVVGELRIPSDGQIYPLVIMVMNDEIYPFWRYEGTIQTLNTLYHIGRYYANDGEMALLNPENF
jgi:hypothetical protein